jgi:hypothetical protein
MSKKHLAGSGRSVGKWVACGAEQQCTLTASQYHTTAAELVQVQQYVENKTGERITGDQLPLASVLEYKTLSETSKEKIANDVEARKEVVRAKKASRTTQPGTALRLSRAEAFEQYEHDADKDKFLRSYLQAYPKLTALPAKQLEAVFNKIEVNSRAIGLSAESTTKGSTLSLTSQARSYKELNDNPSLLKNVITPPAAPAPVITQRPTPSRKLLTAAERLSAPKSFSVSSLEAGLSTRKAVKDSLEQLKARGCTVSYTESRGVMFTTFHNIKIQGPTYVVNYWKEWVRNNLS